ncbi:uncharacterized protein LOC34624236 [Cyclospora cayetanensis]|uniref:Uncharacterized protein LOC34624236 n=1 Tax=Cyclospora cayetanensis TaxID=88456 RepID=A0A6P6RYF6_9EIME|nr:uncharacterized protein LOC34624236 [Cyclospora cayetanensis]
MNLQLTHLHSSRLAEADKIVAFLNKTGAVFVAVFVAVFAAGPASVVGLSKVVTAYSLTHWQCPFWFGCWVWQPVRAALYVAAAAPPSCMLRASEFLEKAVAIAGVAFSAAFSAEGRDKVTKALQYGCRFLAWAVSNSKAASKFTAVYRKPVLAKLERIVGRGGRLWGCGVEFLWSLWHGVQGRSLGQRAFFFSGEM